MRHCFESRLARRDPIWPCFCLCSSHARNDHTANTVQHDSRLNPITALDFYRPLNGPLLLLAGEGFYLNIYDVDKSALLARCRIFDSQTIHGISVREDHASPECLQILIWGGRSFVWLTPNEIQSILAGYVTSTVASEQLASDWILDCAISPFDSVGECIFITAHNVALHFSLQKEPSLSLLPSPSQSILYSAHVIWVSPKSVMAAAGTMFGEIEMIKWNLASGNIGERSEVLFTLSGHEGSVFGVQISPEITGPDGHPARLLASCSDDRTIRVWTIGLNTNREDSAQNGTLIPMRETGFGDNRKEYRDRTTANQHVASVMGHASRIWRVKFLTCLIGAKKINLLSFGEDSDVQQWSLEGWSRNPDIGVASKAKPVLSLVKTFSFHNGKHIWSAALMPGVQDQNYLATGAADGKISMYNVYASDFREEQNEIADSQIDLSDGNAWIISWTLENLLQKIQVEDNSIPEPLTPIVPEAENTLNGGISSELTKRKKFKQPKILADASNRYAFVTEDQILVTTSFGRILLGSIDRAENTFRELHLPGNKNRDLKSYAMMTGLAEWKRVLMGGTNGVIYIYLDGCEIVEIANVKGKVAGIFELAGSNQASLWVIVTILGRDIAQLISLDLSDTSSKLQKMIAIELPTGFIVTSCGEVSGLLILGSRNGDLAVYGSIRQQVPMLRQKVGTDAITSIVAVPNAMRTPYFLTTSRDGTYCIFSITQNDLSESATSQVLINLVHRGFPPFGPMIEKAWFEKSSLFLCGFRSKNFVVWNERSHYEVQSVECGGAHRSYAYAPRTGAKGAGCLIYTKASKTCIHLQTSPSHRVIRTGGHGREIKACSIYHDKSLLATGAEDTTIRIWKYVQQGGDAEMVCAAVIEKHTAGIQQLQWAKFSDESMYLFSGGGNEEFNVWSISDIPGFGLGVVCEATLDDLSPDHDLRVMSFDTISMPVLPSAPGTARESVYLICLAFSDSTVRIYWYSKQRRFQRVACGRYTAACLTQVRILSNGGTQHILSTSTDGHIVLWEFPTNTVLSPHDPIYTSGVNIPCKDLAIVSRTALHQSAILGLDILPLSLASLPQSDFLLATGGDDNSLGITLFQNWVPVKRLLLPSAHAAAVFGVSFLANLAVASEDARCFRVVTVGGDQRVRLWTIELDEERECGESKASSVRFREDKEGDEIPTSVADVAGLVLFRDTSAHAKILVYGAGLESFTIGNGV